MKYLRLCLLAIVSVMPLHLAAQSTIIGTPHDFSVQNWAQGQVCLPCHTPHRPPFSAMGANGASNILWDHELTTASFAMYAPLASGHSIGGQPGMSSKMCLSCHDGTTAVDSYGGYTGIAYISGDALIGTDLRDDHPIGLVYPSGTTGYNDPTSFPANGVRLVTSDGVDNRVECDSCHDPHGIGYSKFLRGTMAGSALCLQCHDK